MEEKLSVVTNQLYKMNHSQNEVVKAVERQTDIQEDKDNQGNNQKKTFSEAVKGVNEEKNPTQKKRKSVTWFGTSVSKVLDAKKFAEDANTDVKVVKAYCIQEEGKFPKSNFCAVVPNELKNNPADVVVLQT